MSLQSILGQVRQRTDGRPCHGRRGVEALYNTEELETVAGLKLKNDLVIVWIGGRFGDVDKDKDDGENGEDGGKECKSVEKRCLTVKLTLEDGGGDNTGDKEDYRLVDDDKVDESV